MNPQLKDINKILDLCDGMIDFINKNGIICTGNPQYEEYKMLIRTFFYSQDSLKKDYGPYQVLDKLYFQGRNYSVNLSEAEMIRSTVAWMKHDLFPVFFDKVFISHREKDKEQVAAFIELLHAIGISRPRNDGTENMIFCTSHPSSYIKNGERNLDEIKKQFLGHDHVLYILWYTDLYFESQACLNEAGAIWGMNKKYQEILSPSFKSEKIGGLLDKQPVWFRSNDKFRLNEFKEQLEHMFGLKPLNMNDWEVVRDKFIKEVESLDNGTL